MSVRIINADVMDGLAQLPEESVHCVVTSPPYWGLRDYGVPGQIGLEPTPEAYVEKMVAVFREVRRVLRKDGTCWLNLGDSYFSTTKGSGGGWANDPTNYACKGLKFQAVKMDSGDLPIKPKDLVGIPWRVAFALQADGWWLRQDIIWSKPNPMPESVTDRCTKAHEYLFLLAKSERYFFDATAIAEDLAVSSIPRLSQDVENQIGTTRANGGAKSNGNFRAVGDLQTGKRNKRSVWEVTTQPFPEAHFATFPPALIEPCIKAGCPEQCCSKCGAPWERVQERTSPDGAVVTVAASDRFAKRKDGTPVMGDNAYDQTVSGPERERGSFGASRGVVQKETIGWRQSCQCKAIKSPVCYLSAPTVPGTALDPFGGSGTTGLVADRLKRNAVLIELNANYAAMAERRIAGDCPMFAEVSAA